MPTTTYRLQLHHGFTLVDARQVAPYLSALGVTDVYCSPIFTANPGSSHGYDVCSHNEISSELGGEPQYEALLAELESRGMGLILDFVPNHMSNDPHTNEWWRDVLENGPSSPFASFFDIDWDPVKPELKERLLLPILSEQYGEALESGRLRLRFEAGALRLEYRDYLLPINPRRSPLVLELELGSLAAQLGEEDARLREFLSILTALRNLPPYTERDPQKIAERQREKEVARERLERLGQSCSAIDGHIAKAVEVVNGTPGNAASFDRLHELLELQAYRLASWRTASDEINYRRFFDINELAGLRVEDQKVFDHIHSLVFRLVAATRTVTGLRIDHIDGLFDPTGYLRRLQDAVQQAVASRTGDHATGGFYIAVEKILAGSEALRSEWPVAGTTGYNFLNDLNGLFVDPRSRQSLLQVYARFSGQHGTFPDVAHESKKLIVSTAMSSEFQVLVRAVNRLSEHDRRSRDFTAVSIGRALREVVASFPVYRTYVSDNGALPADVHVVDTAIREARRRNPALESSIFDFVRAILLTAGTSQPDRPSALSDEKSRLDVAMRFQQYTAPVQAKGVEDTAFYRYHVLMSLNEVGGDPDRFGVSVDDFHAASARRLAHWPGEMLATTTHDTKRSEDVRARLNVLSEIHEEWRKAVFRWRAINRGSRTRLNGGVAPDGNDEYLFYQTLLGTWPAQLENEPIPPEAPDQLVGRIETYMRKAIREAKVHTSWITQNREYESAVSAFVERTLKGEGAPAFLASFVPFARHAGRLGFVNSLSQLVLKLVVPGVPDFYQGTELWDLSLVDPDNRRPVDFAQRQALLADLEPWLARAVAGAVNTGEGSDLTAAVASMLDEWPDGRIKLFVTACGLRLRRTHQTLFSTGAYVPLPDAGLHSGHLVACARQHGPDVIIAIVPRLTGALGRGASPLPIGSETWADTRVWLPEQWASQRLRHLLTGEEIMPAKAVSGGAWLLASRALHTCPVALLSACPA
jgi:(1->4)-alpha-D-glucan 1-alpha-D-glucosylmutase